MPHLRVRRGNRTKALKGTPDNVFDPGYLNASTWQERKEAVTSGLVLPREGWAVCDTCYRVCQLVGKGSEVRLRGHNHYCPGQPWDFFTVNAP